jgi:formate dehydrogenase subunit gamma
MDFKGNCFYSSYLFDPEFAESSQYGIHEVAECNRCDHLASAVAPLLTSMSGTSMSTVASFQADSAEVVKAIVKALGDEPGALLPILHAVQNEFAYVPTEALPLIADGLNLSRAEVHGVFSFYHYFRSSPPGRHSIQICRAESCQAMGSRVLEAHAKQSLKIDFNQTTADGELTLLPVYCLGNCACSPSVRIGNDIYGNVDPEKFDALVSGLSTRRIEVK